jgi:acyl-CoA hydrolase
MYRRGEKKMKKLLVCLMICVLVFASGIEIMGINLTEPGYDGSDLFIITVGEENTSTYVIMKDGVILEVKTLTPEEVKRMLKKRIAYEREV